MGQQMRNALKKFAAPMALGFVNGLIIPNLTDFSSNQLMKHETKTERQKAMFKMNIGSMLLNYVFLPLTGLVSYSQLM
jgi:hypothetical protein